MRRVGILGVAVAAAIIGVGCSSDGAEFTNRLGDCVFEPRAVCLNQDFTALNLDSTDLTGANFSGSSFRNAELRDVVFRDADLSNVVLSGADMTGADLRGANLQGAELFAVTMDRVRWGGANRTGIKYCETLLPNGDVSGCPSLEVTVTTVLKGPPAIVTFAPHAPGRCIVDAIGEGIEVDWKLRNSTSAVFLVDDDEVSTEVGAGGVKRIPFPCDHRTHTVSIEATGDTPPDASRSFRLKLGPTAPRKGI